MSVGWRHALLFMAPLVLHVIGQRTPPAVYWLNLVLFVNLENAQVQSTVSRIQRQNGIYAILCSFFSRFHTVDSVYSVPYKLRSVEDDCAFSVVHAPSQTP